MRNILDEMTLDDARGFINGKGFKYTETYLSEKFAQGVALMLTLNNSNEMFALQGELTATQGMINLLKAFKEVVNPSQKPIDKNDIDPMANYQSQKPIELVDPLSLPDFIINDFKGSRV